MGKFSLLKFCLSIIYSFLFIFLLSQVSNALNLSADWRYNTQKAEKRKWTFNHTYGFSFSKDVTDAINFSLSTRYNQTKTEGFRSSQLAPSVNIFLRNDLFSLNVSDTSAFSKNSDGPDFTSNSWNANFFTTFKNFPEIRFSYSGAKSFDGLMWVMELFEKYLIIPHPEKPKPQKPNTQYKQKQKGGQIVEVTPKLSLQTTKRLSMRYLSW